MALLPIDPKRRKQAQLLIAAVIVAGWYVGKMYVLDPRQAQIKSSSGLLARLDSQNRRAGEIIRGYGDLDARVELQERQLRIFEEFIPDREEVPELLDAISHEAQLVGIELSRLRPQAAEPREFYTRQTWELSLLGEYHDIGRYLGRIASLPRIIKPAGVNITPAAWSRATRDMTAPLEVSLRIETFVLGTVPGAEPTGGEGAS
jgi:type IV pilus assembly protein PilO